MQNRLRQNFASSYPVEKIAHTHDKHTLAYDDEGWVDVLDVAM